MIKLAKVHVPCIGDARPKNDNAVPPTPAIKLAA